MPSIHMADNVSAIFHPSDKRKPSAENLLSSAPALVPAGSLPGMIASPAPSAFPAALPDASPSALPGGIAAPAFESIPGRFHPSSVRIHCGAICPSGIRLNLLSMETGHSNRRATMPQSSTLTLLGALFRISRKAATASTSHPAVMLLLNTSQKISLIAHPPFGSGLSSAAPGRSPSPSFSHAL